MAVSRASIGWLLLWLGFYLGLLPYAGPLCLYWLSSPSNALLGRGALVAAGLAGGIGLSVYQAGRALARSVAARPPSEPSPSADHEPPARS